MKLGKHYFSVCILLIILAIFCSCNGQAKSKNQQNKQSLESNNSIQLDLKATVIYHDSKGNFWFGSKEKGVYSYDGKNLVLYTLKNGLCSYVILSVQEDTHGNLYFDTPDGVCKFDGQRFTTLTVIGNAESKNEWKLEPNDLWFRMGWDHNGPFRFDGKNLYHLEFPKNKMEDEFYKKYPSVTYNPYGLYSIFKDSKDNIWLGTSNLGIYLFDGKEISWMYENHLTDTPEGGSFGIRSITEDKKGKYWICNANYKYTLLPNEIDTSELKSLNYTREIGIENKQNLYFLSMQPDSNGDIWMQTYDQGIWKNNGKSIKQFVIKIDGEEIIPTSFFIDNNQKLWFGTDAKGIYKYNGKTFEKFKI